MQTICQRKKIRLREYDYRRAGFYFVTVCVQNRAPLFGNVVDGRMELNSAGILVQNVWHRLPELFSGIELHDHIVMPNHVHGVIAIVKDRATTRVAPTGSPEPVGVPLVGTPVTIGDVVGAFKSISSVEYIRGINDSGWPEFQKRLWQRNYYEHIIRDEASHAAIEQYIENNPAQWRDDELFVG